MRTEITGQSGAALTERLLADIRKRETFAEWIMDIVGENVQFMPNTLTVILCGPGVTQRFAITPKGGRNWKREAGIARKALAAVRALDSEYQKIQNDSAVVNADMRRKELTLFPSGEERPLAYGKNNETEMPG